MKASAVNDRFILDLLNDPDYKVEGDGVVWTLITVSGKRSAGGTWRVAGTAKLKKGIRYVTVRYKRREFRAHRVVYAKLKGPLHPDLVINHLDGNGLNNHPDNLELVTQGKNNLHKYRTLNRFAVFGSAKITFDIAAEIRDLSKLGVPYSALVKQFGLSKGTISSIVNFKSWNSIACFEVGAPKPKKRSKSKDKISSLDASRGTYL
jgi:hypothetical protein